LTRKGKMKDERAEERKREGEKMRKVNNTKSSGKN
jgi:hypothetical protein